MMGWYQDGWTWGTAGMTGMLLMIVFWGLLIGGAVWAVARATRTGPSTGTTVESARGILDRRFASGEIDVEEYAHARHVLESRSTTTSR